MIWVGCIGCTLFVWKLVLQIERGRILEFTTHRCELINHLYSPKPNSLVFAKKPLYHNIAKQFPCFSPFCQVPLTFISLFISVTLTWQEDCSACICCISKLHEAPFQEVRNGRNETFNKRYTPWNFTANDPEKSPVGRYISFWGPANFQGRFVSFRESIHPKKQAGLIAITLEQSFEVSKYWNFAQKSWNISTSWLKYSFTDLLFECPYHVQENSSISLGAKVGPICPAILCCDI